VASNNVAHRHRHHHRNRPQFAPRNSHLSSPEQPSIVPRVTPGPTFLQPQHRHQAQPTVRQHSTSSDEIQYLETQPIQLHCYYPEAIYISDHIPTRSPRELTSFKEHCRLQYNAHRTTLILDLPLSRIREFTSNPLNFQNLLWKSRTTVSHFGIHEEYQWIRRQARPDVVERVIWQPAYKVFYAWDQDGWNVSRLPRNHQ
jgi:hypothetical protein